MKKEHSFQRRRRTIIAGWMALLFLLCSLPLFSLRLFREADIKGTTIPYTIVATVGMVGDVAAEVAGARATVKTLIRSGVDPHLYAPTRSDVQQLTEADLVLYVGLLLEGRMSSTLERLQHKGETIYAVVDILAEKGALPLISSGEHFDPHIWMDVSLWGQVVLEIANILSDFDPMGAEGYQRRAAHYGQQLEELGNYIQQVIASIPTSQRILVTAHDAFSYFGRAYGIRVEGIQGISTESEAGIRRINQLVAFLATNRVPAVFVESSVHDKNVRALIEGVAARGGRVRIGGTLYSDAMGEAGSYKGTYIGMLDHNATIISRALGGNAPRRGLNGRLKQ